MNRYNWLSLCRRHFFCSSASTLQQPLFPHRLLQTCSYSSLKFSHFMNVELPLFNLKRFIHASATSNAPERTYYDVLGVPQNATRDEIKKAYHSLAKKYHPDANKNNSSAKRKFQEIREAYEILHNSEKRAEYDRRRSGGSAYADYDPGSAEGYSTQDTTGFRYDPGEAGGFSNTYGTDFSNSFRKIFSEIFEEEINQFSSDIQVQLELSFLEAAKGCTKNLSFDAYIPCDSCDGIGHAADAKLRVCRICRGRGKVTIPPFVATCSACKGSGRTVEQHCLSCRGSGVVEGTKIVKVSIPAGVESGDTIHVKGAGNVGGRGGQPSSLFIKLKVADDSIFARDGADIYVDAKISFTQAILGGKVDVPTLSGKIEVKIPKGVQHGRSIIVRGKGLPKHGFFVDHGDQYVRFRIGLPTSVNDRQRAILEEFALEEINNERDASIYGDWWQKFLEHLTGPSFMLRFSALMLFLLFLHKITT